MAEKDRQDEDFLAYKVDPVPGKALADSIAREHPVERGYSRVGHMESGSLELGPAIIYKDYSIQLDASYTVCNANWREEPSRRYLCVIRRLGQKTGDKEVALFAEERLLWAKMSHPGIRTCLHESFDEIKREYLYLFQPSVSALSTLLASRSSLTPLSAAELVGLIVSLTSATEYVQAHNIILKWQAYNPIRIVYRPNNIEHPFALENGIFYQATKGQKGRTGDGESVATPYLYLYNKYYTGEDFQNISKLIAKTNTTLLRTLVKLIYYITDYAPAKPKWRFMKPAARDDLAQMKSVAIDKYRDVAGLDGFVSRCLEYMTDANVPHKWTFKTVHSDARSLLLHTHEERRAA